MLLKNVAATSTEAPFMQIEYCPNDGGPSGNTF